MITRKIQHFFRNKKYSFFVRGNYNLNIVGIRSAARYAGEFDDLLVVMHREQGRWVEYTYPITTDPGVYWLHNPSRVDGTAILVPGQYRGVYAIDKHRGRYDALCQRHGAVRVYRDDNRDSIIDMLPDTTQEGWYGINIHKSGLDSVDVGKWSAGCQVFKRSSDFNEFMTLCQKSAAIYGNRFTYTLINFKNLEEI